MKPTHISRGGQGMPTTHLTSLAVVAALGVATARSEADDVVVRRLEPLHVLALPMTGSHAQHEQAFARLSAELRTLKAVPKGAPFGRYLNDPRQVPEAELRWEIGVPVGDDVKAQAPFEVKDLPGGETAILVHEGEYASSASAWPRLLEWVVSHGYRPAGQAMQIYLGNPDLSGAAGPRTELRLPVARRERPISDATAASLLSGSWAASEDLRIVVHTPNAPDRALTDGHRDFKPSWSPDGTMLTFFRLVTGAPEFKDWRTQLCVIKADGTDLRQLTSGAYADFNPTWTRDGTQRIVFNRYSPQGGWHNRAYWTSPDAAPGQEQLVSDPSFPYFEWVTGALHDGRLFVDRVTPTSVDSYLLRPDPGRTGRYEHLQRPTGQVWHKLTISPSETRVAYMLDRDRNAATYEDVILCYANLDLAALTISDQVEITKASAGAIREYPAWARDETLIYYDSNELGRYQLFAYRLADAVTRRVSPHADRDYQFVALEGLPR
jgi:DNA gyrase inhibitor GyrI